tara:strand:- start:1389 stop:1859 length:471 start_codon:yes stop_codon:yes gene_type:complete
MSKKEVKKSNREKILELENKVISIADGINIEGTGKEILTNSKIAPITHNFADGIYIRQMNMQKDSIVIGAIHKHLHAWFLLTGHITVATEDKVEDYIAPYYTLSTPGVKRVIHAIEDSIFVNIHKNPSNTQDIDKLEKEIVALNYKEYEEYINQKN